MPTYGFDVILRNFTQVTDELSDRLFDAGCDDGAPASCDGIAWVHFDREARSLEEAFRSAVAQVQAAGFIVAKVELEVDSGISLEA